MNFDYKEVLKTLPKAKKFVLSNKNVESLPFLGQGGEGSVYVYDNVAIKQISTCITLRNEDEFKKAIERCKKGIELGINFAPILDTVKKRYIYTFMPKLEGQDIKFGTVEKLSCLSAEAYEKFFEDYKTLHDIGLKYDSSNLGNIFISESKDSCKKHLDIIDFGLGYEATKIEGWEMIAENRYNSALKTIMMPVYMHQRSNKQDLKLCKEIFENVETATKRIKLNERMIKSLEDFKRVIY